MARKMALVPQDLVSEYYELNKPEIRVEDNISKLLNEEETPDDVKAKLLSHWIPKYQRLMQPPPPQKPFEIPKELLQETEAEQEISSPAPSKLNMIAKYIAYTIPKTRKKYILPILEKLREVNYMFNDMNELQRNGKIEYRSNGIDLFSYLMRNEKAVSHPPTGFNTFLQGILDANIPLGWIGNKYVKDMLLLSQMDPKWKERESSSAITPESTRAKKLTAERLRKLSNGENAPEASETRPKKWTTWKDVRKLSNQESSPESQKTQPVNWTTWKD
ncbi:uncharacterized protein TNCT_203901 [Trichonephila clavata]|uniref:Uncharacterized protein n=1 Tax=Trichonephila clavata TaxID=2740835 RepID=A0A8X6EYE0_TRICU|nr:uncharacterized protein TNCT_203901 [Trichonephila clavata]